MKIFLYKTLLILSCLFFISNAKAGSAYFNSLIAGVDMSGLDEEQHDLVINEAEAYEKNIAPLYTTNLDEYKKKLNDFFAKLAFGFRVYNLTSKNEALKDSLESFYEKTNLKVYVTSYVEGAFLNNLFQKLAELKYKVRVNKSIQLKYRFKKQNENDDIDLFDYSLDVIVSDAVRDTLKNLVRARLQKQLDVENAYKNLTASISDKNYAIFKSVSESKVNANVEEVLSRFTTLEIKLSPQDRVLGWIECVKFCNMTQDERCAYIFYKLLEDFDNDATYIKLPNNNGCFVKAKISLGIDGQEIEIEKVFKPYTKKEELKEYVEFLKAWQVDYLYTGLIEAEIPKIKMEDFNPSNDKSSCIGLCISYSNHNPPAFVKLIADVLTAPVSAPGKILYGKNFIFEEDEVTSLDKGLAFLDVPGVGVITKTIALKVGVKAILVSGVVKVLSTVDVINDIINRSGVSDAVKLVAKNAIKALPAGKQGFVLRGLVDKTVKVDEIADFINVINKTTSNKWNDIIDAWRIAKSSVYKAGSQVAGITIKQIRLGTNGKYAIIGRSMGNLKESGVKNVFNELKNVKNFDVEIFEASSLSGVWKTKFDDALQEFASKTKNWTVQLTQQELMQLKMYKLNKEWAQKLVDDGYTILDMGDFNNKGFSVFYSMEKSIIFK